MGQEEGIREGSTFEVGNSGKFLFTTQRSIVVRCYPSMIIFDSITVLLDSFIKVCPCLALGHIKEKASANVSGRLAATRDLCSLAHLVINLRSHTNLRISIDIFMSKAIAGHPLVGINHCVARNSCSRVKTLLDDFVHLILECPKLMIMSFNGVRITQV